VLEKALSEGPKTGSKPPVGAEKPREIVKGVKIEARRGRVVLSGAGVTEALRRTWRTGSPRAADPERFRE
jgi:hypothetical protein